MRDYYLDDGKEVTNWFAWESEFATCFYAFITGKNSFEIIETLEDCELIQISYSSLQTLYTGTAKERYQNLILSKLFLLQRASLGHIASYIGIPKNPKQNKGREINPWSKCFLIFVR